MTIDLLLAATRPCWVGARRMRINRSESKGYANRLAIGPLACDRAAERNFTAISAVGLASDVAAATRGKRDCCTQFAARLLSRTHFGQHRNGANRVKMRLLTGAGVLVTRDERSSHLPEPVSGAVYGFEP
jgi:hypothetical protein